MEVEELEVFKVEVEEEEDEIAEVADAPTLEISLMDLSPRPSLLPPSSFSILWNHHSDYHHHHHMTGL